MQSALRRMWIVRNIAHWMRACASMVQAQGPGSIPGVPILRKEIPPQYIFLKHPVEIWGVLLYDRKNVIGGTR